MIRLRNLALFFMLLTGLSVASAIFYKPQSLAKLPTVKKGQPLPSNLFVELAKLVNPAVVNINTSTKPRQMNVPRGRQRDPFFDLFAPFMMPQQRQPRTSLGTGFVVREDGHIITNNHVIDGADIIKVQLSEEGELFEAEVIGKDVRSDIALIKITSKKKLPTIKLGSSKNLEVGEWVAAFGNPFGHGHTMTKGIISAIGRDIDELNKFPFIQTDASINPGNSGGPLVNMKGEVIAVNTAIDARAQGIGFAIPVDDVKNIIRALEKDGGIKRGFLGVSLAQYIDRRAMDYLQLKDLKGALVEHVYPDTPAAKAGLKPYDFIVKVGKDKIESPGDLIRSIADTSVGSKVNLEYIREGKTKKVSIKIEQHPEDNFNKPDGRKVKSYQGQKAPFDLGFKISDLTRQLKKEFELPNLRKKRPVIIDVDPGSVASRGGLAPGDVILDVNKKPVYSPKDVLKTLNKKFNVLRVLRGDRALLIYLQV